MSYLIGASLALGVCRLLGTVVGFDRDKAFYPTQTIVVASYYALFAIMAQAMSALWMESVFMLLFLVASVMGFKRSLWVVVGALCAHGVFDLFHAHLIANPGVPVWWPAFCLAYDVAAGAYLAWVLRRSAPDRPTVAGRP